MYIVSDSESYGFQMNVSFLLTVPVQKDTDQRQVLAHLSRLLSTLITYIAKKNPIKTSYRIVQHDYPKRL
jgi:hypothetical protein